MDMIDECAFIKGKTISSFSQNVVTIDGFYFTVK